MQYFYNEEIADRLAKMGEHIAGNTDLLNKAKSLVSYTSVKIKVKE